MPQPKEQQLYTVDYIYSLPEGERAELIDGVVYAMSAPNRLHQRISNMLSHQLTSAIEKNNGSCEVYAAPFEVRLNNDDYTYIEPDISLICNTNKLNDRGCIGAPELVMEIVSPSSIRMDYIIKLNKYDNAGVFEYWIIDPEKEQITIYERDRGTFGAPKTYKITDEVKVGIIKDCKIKLDI